MNTEASVQIQNKILQRKNQFDLVVCFFFHLGNGGISKTFRQMGNNLLFKDRRPSSILQLTYLLSINLSVPYLL